MTLACGRNAQNYEIMSAREKCMKKKDDSGDRGDWPCIVPVVRGDYRLFSSSRLRIFFLSPPCFLKRIMISYTFLRVTPRGVIPIPHGSSPGTNKSGCTSLVRPPDHLRWVSSWSPSSRFAALVCGRQCQPLSCSCSFGLSSLWGGKLGEKAAVLRRPYKVIHRSRKTRTAFYDAANQVEGEVLTLLQLMESMFELGFLDVSDMRWRAPTKTFRKGKVA